MHAGLLDPAGNRVAVRVVHVIAEYLHPFADEGSAGVRVSQEGLLRVEQHGVVADPVNHFFFFYRQLKGANVPLLLVLGDDVIHLAVDEWADGLRTFAQCGDFCGAEELDGHLALSLCRHSIRIHRHGRPPRVTPHMCPNELRGDLNAVFRPQMNPRAIVLVDPVSRSAFSVELYLVPVRAWIVAHDAPRLPIVSIVVGKPDPPPDFSTLVGIGMPMDRRQMRSADLQCRFWIGWSLHR
mmetsp:Transcript_10319/g.29419  ORF Transcript_10319/g.29419 Transcript_10319/m.29419 type:complete len:239 (-) Transcript_10319:1107-1823(-)